VSALSLSESVPDCMILKRKLASDDAELDEEEDWKVRESVVCSSVAFDISEASSEGDMVDVDGAWGVSGSTAVYHCEIGWKTKCNLGLNDTFIGSCNLGASSIGGSDCFATDTLGAFFCFLPDLGNSSVSFRS
jgi:hypothetical protein